MLGDKILEAEKMANLRSKKAYSAIVLLTTASEGLAQLHHLILNMQRKELHDSSRTLSRR